MVGQTTLLYVGTDDVFLKNLKKELSTKLGVDSFTFESIFFEGDEYPSIFLKRVLELKPAIVFLDFSYLPDKMYEMAWTLRSSRDTINLPIIGLLSTLNEEETDTLEKQGKNELIFPPSLRSALRTFVPIIHYKGEGYSNMIFDGQYLMDFSTRSRPIYATYKQMKFETTGMVYSKLTHVMPENLIIESNLSLETHSKIIIRSDENKILNGKLMTIMDSSDKQHRSGLKNRYRLQLNFLDEDALERLQWEEEQKRLEEEEKRAFEEEERRRREEEKRINGEGKEEEEEEEEEVSGPDEEVGEKAEEEKEKKTESMVMRETMLKDEVYDQWFNGLEGESIEKNFKVLLIQQDLKSLENLKKPIAEYPFSIKFQTTTSTEIMMIRNYLPHLIAFELDELEEGMVGEVKSESESEKNKKTKNGKVLFNDIELLQDMINAIKNVHSYNPFIIVFKSMSKAEAFQKTFSYEYILSNPNEANLDFLERMFQIFKTDESRMAKAIEDNLVLSSDTFVQLNMLEPNSDVQIEMPITITSLSEHEITFATDKHIPFLTVLRIFKPLPILITVIKPIKDLEKVQGKAHNMGLIHGRTILAYMEIRKYVNFLFFQELEAKKKAEQEEYEAKKAKMLRQREREQEWKRKRLEEEEKGEVDTGNGPDGGPATDDQEDKDGNDDKEGE